MAREVYKPVWSIDIPGKDLENVQGEPVTPATAPFVNGHIEAFSLACLGEYINHNVYPDATVRLRKLVQISPYHGRSFELRFRFDTDKRKRRRKLSGFAEKISSPLWTDEYGNFFAALSTKGNLVSDPTVVRSDIEPSGFAVNGMQDTAALVRVLKVSRLLREQQIDTECFVRVIEPQELPVSGEMVPLDQFKANLVQQIWDKDGKKDVNIGSPTTRADIPKYSEHLDNSTFVITVRGMQVTERLQDLDKPENKEEFVEMMKRIFKYVNLAEGIKSRKNGTDWNNLNAESDEDLKRYFQDYLPRKIASNYAKLHNLGLLHVYPHQGNVSAVGSIYDLDSVKGEILELNDEKVSYDAQNNEFNKVYRESAATVNAILSKFGLQPRNVLTNEVFDKAFGETYFEQRDVFAVLPQAYQFYEGFGDKEVYDKYYARVVEALGWNFETSFKMPDLLDEFLGTWDRETIDVQVREVLKDTELVNIDKVIEEAFDASGKSIEYTTDRFNDFLDTMLRNEFVDSMDEAQKAAWVVTMNTYGPNITSAIIDLFVQKQARVLKERMSSVESERLQTEGDKNAQNARDYYAQNCRQVYADFVANDPDFDPASKVLLIDGMFEFYYEEDEETMAFLELYINKVSEKNGLNYTHPETVDQLITTFLIDAELRSRLTLDHFVERKDEDETVEEAIDSNLAESFIAEFPETGLSINTRKRIAQTIRDYNKTKVEALEEQYGAGNIATLLELYGQKESVRIEKSMSKEQKEYLTAKTEELTARLKEEYLKQYNG